MAQSGFLMVVSPITLISSKTLERSKISTTAGEVRGAVAVPVFRKSRLYWLLHQVTDLGPFYRDNVGVWPLSR